MMQENEKIEISRDQVFALIKSIKELREDVWTSNMNEKTKVIRRHKLSNQIALLEQFMKMNICNIIDDVKRERENIIKSMKDDVLYDVLKDEENNE